MPTIPALARARRHLDNLGREDVTLIVTGGLRTPADFIKALCLGADGVAVSNSAMQVMARACGHSSLNQFNIEDLTTWKREMAELSGVRFAGAV